MGPGISGIPGARKIWFWLHQDVEFFVLHPLDFAILVDSNGPTYRIEKVWYNNMMFDSLQSFVSNYDLPGFPKLKVPYLRDHRLLDSKMHQRGPTFPRVRVDPPRQVEPQGKRYSVIHNEVTYMNWKFNFRFSATQGPQLFNIRYLGKRIVYELSLQEIAVMYSGAEPTHIFSNFFDTFVMDRSELTRSCTRCWLSDKRNLHRQTRGRWFFF